MHLQGTGRAHFGQATNAKQLCAGSPWCTRHPRGHQARSKASPCRRRGRAKAQAMGWAWARTCRPGTTRPWGSPCRACTHLPAATGWARGTPPRRRRRHRCRPALRRLCPADALGCEESVLTKQMRQRILRFAPTRRTIEIKISDGTHLQLVALGRITCTCRAQVARTLVKRQTQSSCARAHLGALATLGAIRRAARPVLVAARGGRRRRRWAGHGLALAVLAPLALGAVLVALALIYRRRRAGRGGLLHDADAAVVADQHLAVFALQMRWAVRKAC